MSLRLPLVSKILLAFAWLGFVGCSTSSSSSGDFYDPEDDLLRGTIDYPFAETDPIGKNRSGDSFVIRSTVGNQEYSIEIPDSARDYDIEVPLADLARVGAVDRANPGAGPSDVGLPQMTDRELVRAMPKLPEPDDKALVEGAFGLGKKGGPGQAPSYSLRLAKINRLYLGREFEVALVEINNLLSYYPSSAKLYKMKGTVLMKLRNYQLAEIAWSKASDLAPGDSALVKARDSLRRRIDLREKIEANRSAKLIEPTGAPVSTTVQPATEVPASTQVPTPN